MVLHHSASPGQSPKDNRVEAPLLLEDEGARWLATVLERYPAHLLISIFISTMTLAFISEQAFDPDE